MLRTWLLRSMPGHSVMYIYWYLCLFALFFFVVRWCSFSVAEHSLSQSSLHSFSQDAYFFIGCFFPRTSCIWPVEYSCQSSCKSTNSPLNFESWSPAGSRILWISHRQPRTHWYCVSLNPLQPERIRTKYVDISQSKFPPDVVDSRIEIWFRDEWRMMISSWIFTSRMKP